MIQKVCEVCGKKFSVIKCREKTAKYCCRQCSDYAWTLKRDNNVVCTECGKKFHMKASQIKRYSRRMGFFCSLECETKYRAMWFRGANNHQYGLRGDKNASYKGIELPKKNHKNIDFRVYSPLHPFADRNGRVLKHRLEVEKNAELFNLLFFIEIDGAKFLKKEFVVHHRDGDHSNNLIENLEILTRGKHTRTHNKGKIIIRDTKTGRITGVIKQGELLENPKGGAISSQVCEAHNE